MTYVSLIISGNRENCFLISVRIMVPQDTDFNLEISALEPSCFTVEFCRQITEIFGLKVIIGKKIFNFTEFAEVIVIISIYNMHSEVNFSIELFLICSSKLHLVLLKWLVLLHSEYCYILHIVSRCINSQFYISPYVQNYRHSIFSFLGSEFLLDLIYFNKSMWRPGQPQDAIIHMTV